MYVDKEDESNADFNLQSGVVNRDRYLARVFYLEFDSSNTDNSEALDQFIDDPEQNMEDIAMVGRFQSLLGSAYGRVIIYEGIKMIEETIFFGGQRVIKFAYYTEYSQPNFVVTHPARGLGIEEFFKD